MKKLLATVSLLTTLIVSAGVVNALSPAYKAIYCYPTGTYWQKQIANSPAYYSVHNAQFTAKYGATTQYCQ